MRKDTEKPSFFVRLATVIVDKRKLIFFLYACALLFCLFSRNWVSVCNDITEYLPDSTETRQGLTLMEEEFTTFGTARVMVSHVTRGIAEDSGGTDRGDRGRLLRVPGRQHRRRGGRGGRDAGGHRIVFQGRGRADLRDLCGGGG